MLEENLNIIEMSKCDCKGEEGPDGVDMPLLKTFKEIGQKMS